MQNIGDEIWVLVCTTMGVDPTRARERGWQDRRLAHARKIAMFLMSESAGMGEPEIGSFFGRDKRTVRASVASIGDSKEPGTRSAVLSVSRAIKKNLEPYRAASSQLVAH